eukprot:2963945-Rhodomonas_salina.1
MICCIDFLLAHTRPAPAGPVVLLLLVPVSGTRVPEFPVKYPILARLHWMGSLPRILPGHRVRYPGTSMQRTARNVTRTWVHGYAGRNSEFLPPGVHAVTCTPWPLRK